jgi:hypothetical protein
VPGVERPGSKAYHSLSRLRMHGVILLLPLRFFFVAWFLINIEITLHFLLHVSQKNNPVQGHPF